MEKLLEKFNKIGLKFLSPLDTQQTYTLIIKEAIKLIGAQYGALYFREDDKFVRMTSYPSAESVVAPRKNGYNYQSWKNNKILIINKSEIKTIDPNIINHRYKCSIFLPISDHQHSIGTINLLARKEKRLSRKEVGMLKIFGSYATLAINKARLFENLTEALTIRDQFVSLAAHELRTPLTSINGYIQLLHTRIGNDQNTIGKWTRELLKESNRLTGLVTDLLEVNRMKAGELQFSFRQGAISKSLQEAIDDFRDQFPNRNVILNNYLLSGEGIFTGDIDKLSEVFFRILKNAAKFSSDNTSIDISVSRQNDLFIIQIKDQGGGISKENIPKILNGFYRSEIPVQSGLGIGILLSKYVITHHGGSLKISSEDHRGTTVEIRLPVKLSTP